jgi:hypothetical protein
MPHLRKTEMSIRKHDPERAEKLRENPPANMNFAEAACYIGMSPRAFRDHVKCRRFSSIKIGKRIIFQRLQLDRDLQKLTLQSI